MNGMVGSLATAMSLPVVHFEIINELGMGTGILNLPMRFKESFNAIRIALGFHSGANVVIEAGQAQLSFILDDHVVKNHTTCHDVHKGFLSQNRAGPRTMANLACKTPKALSMSLRAAS